MCFQVAFIVADVMADRLLEAEWEYAQQEGKELLPTIYLNKVGDIKLLTYLYSSVHGCECIAWFVYYTELTLTMILHVPLSTCSAYMDGHLP